MSPRAIWGPINASSPKYVGDTVERFIAAQPKPPILWVRGDSDQIVGDNSLFDLGTLGKLGVVPGWPGDEICPPQPMVAQTRQVLEKYQKAAAAFTKRSLPMQVIRRISKNQMNLRRF